MQDIIIYILFAAIFGALIIEPFIGQSSKPKYPKTPEDSVDFDAAFHAYRNKHDQ